MRNKFTEELKQVILDGLHNGDDEGLFGFVRDTSVDTPTAALALLRRSSPSRCLARSTTPSGHPAPRTQQWKTALRKKRAFAEGMANG
ncbi:hypothetical protein [Roseiarcus sp.]|uniref:hypothetical protein n=1 Tax=Roseiarcus sp. TaxID=1969460 RepID=UPI003F9CB57D